MYDYVNRWMIFVFYFNVYLFLIFESYKLYLSIWVKLKIDCCVRRVQPRLPKNLDSFGRARVL